MGRKNMLSGPVSVGGYREGLTLLLARGTGVDMEPPHLPPPH